MTDKLCFGGLGEGMTRPYGFIEGGTGIFKNETKQFIEMPLFGETKIGGGLEMIVLIVIQDVVETKKSINI